MLLGDMASAVIAELATVDAATWNHVPAPDVWSIGKDAEHVIEAGDYHLWIVRRTTGTTTTAGGRPTIERVRLTTELSRKEATEVLGQRVDASAALIRGLSDAHLDLPTRPPRAGEPTLEQTIERVLIAHYEVHRKQIASKARLRGG